MRDRAGDLLAEEADLAATLARTWEVPEGRTFPALHLPFDRLLVRTDAPVWSVTVAPEGPQVATVPAVAWNPVVGDGAALVKQLAELSGDGYRVLVAADGEGSALRLGDLLREHGADPDVVVGPLERGCILPSVKVAVLAEADVTGRRRAHRRARP